MVKNFDERRFKSMVVDLDADSNEEASREDSNNAGAVVGG
jgi:hypothetical protein